MSTPVATRFDMMSLTCWLTCLQHVDANNKSLSFGGSGRHADIRHSQLSPTISSFFLLLMSPTVPMYVRWEKMRRFAQIVFLPWVRMYLPKKYKGRVFCSRPNLLSHYSKGVVQIGKVKYIKNKGYITSLIPPQEKIWVRLQYVFLYENNIFTKYDNSSKILWRT